MKARVVVALCATAAAVGAITHGPFAGAAPAVSAPQTQVASSTHHCDPGPVNQVSACFVWNHAQRIIDRTGVKVPWDGRYDSGTKHGFCIEVFNGTTHDIRFHHLVPSGGYLKLCSDGNYWYNDGVAFGGMLAY